MEYTYEQKCVAAIECKLWWRFPDSRSQSDRTWALVHEDVANVEASDLKKPNAEYHIGDKPPRVLSDLERELLAALEQADDDFASEGFCTNNRYREAIRAAIAKAKGEA